MTVAAIRQKTQSILAAWSKPYPRLLAFHDSRLITYRHLDEIVSNLQERGDRLVLLTLNA